MADLILISLAKERALKDDHQFLDLSNPGKEQRDRLGDLNQPSKFWKLKNDRVHRSQTHHIEGGGIGWCMRVANI